MLLILKSLNDDRTELSSSIEITYMKLTFLDKEEKCNQISVRDDHLIIIEYPTAITEYIRE